jgi:hypothetical protein
VTPRACTAVAPDGEKWGDTGDRADDGKVSESACVAVGMGASTASFVGSGALPAVLSVGRDNGVDLYEDEAMRTLVVLATLAAATGLAAPAHADPSPDAGFLAALDKASITYHSGPEAVAAAKQVCDWINQGQRRSDVIETVSTVNPGFTMSNAAEFTTLAERAYCPQTPGEPAAQQPPPPPPSWYQIQFPLPAPGAG